MDRKESISSLLRELHVLRPKRGQQWCQRRLALLSALRSKKIKHAGQVRGYHDELLYLLAFPDSREVRTVVTQELERLVLELQSLCGEDKAFELQLIDSGILNTSVDVSLSVDFLRWVLERYPTDVDIDWESEPEEDVFVKVLRFCVLQVERDGLLNNTVDFEQWLSLASGGNGTSSLLWLTRRLLKLSCSPEILDYVFSSLELAFRWKLRAPEVSRTFCRFPSRRMAYFSQPFRDSSVRAVTSKRLSAPLKLSKTSACKVIDSAMATLAVRNRETDPITYASEHDVLVFSLEDGVDVVLFGMTPEHRQPIESYIGYVATQNSVPVAYGGSWMFFERADIGINVFPEFRKGRSSAIFAQILRVYAQYFGIRRFYVDPYQFGAGNEEGLNSGAFWFYYKHGFRPVDQKAARIASEESEKIRNNRSYRSPRRTLGKIVTAPLVFHLETPRQASEIPTVQDLGLLVTRVVGEKFQGSRAEAERWAVRFCMRALNVRETGSWPKAELNSFRQLSLLVSLISDLGDWKSTEKKALVSTMRRKGGNKESSYVNSLRKHQRLKEALCSLPERFSRAHSSEYSSPVSLVMHAAQKA